MSQILPFPLSSFSSSATFRQWRSTLPARGRIAHRRGHHGSLPPLGEGRGDPFCFPLGTALASSPRPLVSFSLSRNRAIGPKNTEVSPNPPPQAMWPEVSHYAFPFPGFLGYCCSYYKLYHTIATNISFSRFCSTPDFLTLRKGLGRQRGAAWVQALRQPL